jgi:N6-adenosine-specific RNA methylase IME4
MTAITCLGKSYEVHPSAARFPLKPDEVASMGESIREHGQEEDIVTYQGMILDGRTRLSGCHLAGVEPRFREWNGECGTPVTYIGVKNLERRHMETGQRAMIGADLREDLLEESKARQVAGLKRGSEAPVSANLRSREDAGKASETAAAIARVSPRSIETAAEIKRRDPAKAQQVRDGELTLNAAKRELDRKVQNEEIRTYRPIEGLFSVVDVDFPWPFDVRNDDETHRGRTDYEQMSMEEILAWPLAAKLDENAIVFLWVTCTHLMDGSAAAVLKANGLTPKALYTWVKVDADGDPRYGGGNWGRNVTEHVILSVKGRPHIDTAAAANTPTVFMAPRTSVHSEKPDAFYELAERLCPHPAKLSLFSRKLRAGWVCDGAHLDAERPAPTRAAATEPPAFSGSVDQLERALEPARGTVFEVGDTICVGHVVLNGINITGQKGTIIGGRDDLGQYEVRVRNPKEKGPNDKMIARLYPAEMGKVVPVDFDPPPAAAPSLEDIGIIALRSNGAGFDGLVESLAKGDLVEVKHKGAKGGTARALVQGWTNDHKLIAKLERLDRKQQPNGYADAAHHLPASAVLSIVAVAERHIDLVHKVYVQQIEQWARDELDPKKPVTWRDVNDCWVFLLAQAGHLKANQRPAVGAALRAAHDRMNDPAIATGGIKPQPPARPPAKLKRGVELVDHGEI